jgi:hypothetical protein
MDFILIFYAGNYIGGQASFPVVVSGRRVVRALSAETSYRALTAFLLFEHTTWPLVSQ